MLGLSIILTVDEKLFLDGSSSLYDFYLKISPQLGYAITAFVIAITLFIAFILSNRVIEMIGLFASGMFTLIILSGYLTTFPNIGSNVFAIWTLATFMTIVEIINNIQDEKEIK